MVGSPGYRSKGIHALVVTRKDALEITEALRAAFPSLRITYRSYKWRFIDEPSYDARKREWYGNRGFSRGIPEPGFDMRDPRGEPFPYLASLAVPDVTDFQARLEPPGWKPRWTHSRNERGLFNLLNEPRFWFLFHRGSFRVNSKREPDAQYRFVDPPHPRSSEEEIVLTGYQVWAKWPIEDKAFQSFFGKVLRIVARLTTDSFISVGADYKARTAEPFRSGGSYYRAGKDACAWALQRRHNYFQDLWKPGNYPFKPNEIYTPEELAAERARDEARFAEMMAKTEEQIEANRLRRPRAKHG